MQRRNRLRGDFGEDQDNESEDCGTDDNGFFAAFLAVLDGLLMARDDAEVIVDWRIQPENKHFTYAPTNPDDCVWIVELR